VGKRVPANCTAIGKALLSYEDLDDLAMFLPSPLPAGSITSIDVLIAQLRQVRRLGLAQESDEATQGLACMAAPIVGRGFAVAAVPVAHPTAVPLDPKTSSALRDTASRIAKEILGGLTGDRERWFPAPGQA
jgi:DNA-binding IclR family transcriptional regulator